MSVITLVPYHIGASWREEKSKYAEKLMQKVESRFPGLKAHTLVMEGASPRTMERYTLELDRIDIRLGGVPSTGGPREASSQNSDQRVFTFLVTGLSLAVGFTR